MFISLDFVVDGCNDNIQMSKICHVYLHDFVVDGCNDNMQMSKICHVYFT